MTRLKSWRVQSDQLSTMQEQTVKSNATTPKTDKVRAIFSHFTLVLTVAFGFVTTLTLIEEPSKTLSSSAVSSSSSSSFLEEGRGARGIASVSALSSEASGTQATMATLDVGCSASEGYNTRSEHVRLRGKRCHGLVDHSKEREVASSELVTTESPASSATPGEGARPSSLVRSTVVKNKTNGYFATVFSQGDDRYTTDYVALVPGKNEIVIETKYDNDQVSTQEIQIYKE